ncbi:YggS family pyridoxal phosphate-dependent enzyme [bacterium]|nr:MAG: YggS family pyridoxal phosphate-dependent enzyme [bacterium]
MISTIKENAQKILRELPEGVELVAAAKQRKPEEIMEAIEAGIKIVGQNYIGEARTLYKTIGKRAKWHFIGISKTVKHDLLRRNVLQMFDMIETIDSEGIASELDGRCAQINKIMPILIEINSGREPQKSGVMPDNVEELLARISSLQNIKVMGLMTMGPRFGDPEESRPYFIETRKIFDNIKTCNLFNAEMKYLSMGMTNSYKIAIEEGANMVRIGTKLFGERK